jgi:hypothetical protein
MGRGRTRSRASGRSHLRGDVATTPRDDCELKAWQEEQDFDLDSGKASWVEEARWTLAAARGTTSTTRTPKFIVLGLGRQLHVRTDCRDWTIQIRGVDLGHGKVPGAPKSWDGLSELDCMDFGTSQRATLFLSNFGEAGWMLYNLDGDGDGVACEMW